MKKTFVNGTIITLLLGLCPLFSADQKYTVKMHRPFLAGYKYGIVTTSHDRLEMKMVSNSDGSILNREEKEFNLLLEAAVEVLEVSPLGEPISCRYTIKNFIDQTKKDRPSVLPRESIVTARISGKHTVFSIDGSDVEGDLKEQLKSVISLRSDEENMDLVYGPNKPVNIGEKWSINASRVADSLRSDNVKIDDKDIRGEAYIGGIVKKAGVDCMEIFFDVTISFLNFSFPETITIKESSSQMHLKGIVPVDLNGRYIEDSMNMSFSVNASGALNEQYPDVTITAQASITKKTEYIH